MDLGVLKFFGFRNFKMLKFFKYIRNSENESLND